MTQPAARNARTSYRRTSVYRPFRDALALVLFVAATGALAVILGG